MCFLKRKRGAGSTARFLLFLLLAACALYRPACAAEGVAHGLALCCNTIIPALFPFFVLTKLILTHPLSARPGALLLPYTRLLGIRSPKAGTALLLGLLGGFGGGANAIATLTENGELTPHEAEVLLCCAVNAGPAFVVNGVGTLVLGSSTTGWLLLAALCVASLICGLAAALVLRLHAQPPAPPTPPAPPAAFADALRDAVSAVLVLCGYVVFFSFAIQLFTPADAAPWVRFLSALPLEPTAACAAAGSLPAKVPLCCAALSVMGLSIFLQVRALMPAQVRLLPLVCSRVLHLPVALGCLAVLLRVVPVALTASQAPRAVISAPPDALLFVFLLCAAFFCAFPAKKSLPRP